MANHTNTAYDSRFTIYDVLLSFAFAIFAQGFDLAAKISISSEARDINCHELPCS